jgi:hypothetical protein
VFNPKISGIIAGLSFVISFLVGLFTGSQFLSVLLRALVLAFVFFVLSSLAYWLISRFIPELLTPTTDESGENDIPGSKVDISIDSSEDETESIKNNTSGADNSDGDELGNSILASAQGLDQKRQDDYNEGGSGVVSSTPNSANVTAIPEDSGSESVDVLPDLESMSGYFAPSEESDEESDVVEMEDDVSSSFPSMSEPSRTKKNSQSGDFNVQEMASAIQTILRRDEKG